jgi:hypothetical protein
MDEREITTSITPIGGAQTPVANVEDSSWKASDNGLIVIERGARDRDTIPSLTWEAGLGPQDP